MAIGAACAERNPTEASVIRFGSPRPTPSADDAIREALRCIVESIDLDGSTLFERGEHGDLVSTQAWWRPGCGTIPSGVSLKDSFALTFPQLMAGELTSLSSPDELPDSVDRATLRRLEIKSIVVVPLAIGPRILGALAFGTTRSERQWCDETLERLRVSAGLFITALAHPRNGDECLRPALVGLKRNGDYGRTESSRPRKVADALVDSSRLLGDSAAIRHVYDQVRQVAQTDATVLLLGETGSGKEVFASEIHQLSRRQGREMIRVNCAAIPATLIESELFGREKGAYTGALTRQIGRFELADNSTIFLDEIGDLPSDVQVKLLRVLEDKQVERLGGSKATKIDTRIIAATHRDLEKRIEADTFREDLYYRLNVFPIRVPPLRERTEDIPMLVWRFVEDFSSAFGRRVESISKSNMEMLQRYSWPGNVRELRNLVERAVIGATGPSLTIALPQMSTASVRRSVKLFDVEKEHIKAVLDSTRWRIRGAGGAADQLGLKATTLETRMAKLGLQRPRH